MKRNVPRRPPARPGAGPRVGSFCLLGHRASGKTSLGDLLLQAAGVTREVGRVDAGTSLLDADVDAIARRSGVAPSTAWLEWQDGVLQLVDTPGAEGARWDREAAVLSTDLSVIVVRGADGVQAGTRRAAELAGRYGRPRVAVISSLERCPDVEAIRAALERACGVGVALVHLPLLEEGEVAGVVDVLHRKVLRYDRSGNGTFSEEPFSDALAAAAQHARDRLCEAVSVTDDALLEHYLEYLDLDDDVLEAGLALAVQAGRVVPVALTSAARGIGAEPLLALLLKVAPDPAALAERLDLSGTVVQWAFDVLDAEHELCHVLRIWSGDVRENMSVFLGTTEVKLRKLYALRGPRRRGPVVAGAGALLGTWDPLPGRPGDAFSGHAGDVASLPRPSAPSPMVGAVVTATGASRAVLERALSRLGAVDPGLQVAVDDRSPRATLRGAASAEVERALLRLQGRFGIAVTTEPLPVPYLETVAGPALGVRAQHRKADGDLVSEFGEVVLDVTPAWPEPGLAFANEIPEEQVPVRLSSGARAGVERAMRLGPAGFPVAAVRVRAVEGEYDILESTPEHFALAAERAMRAALERAGTDLLEPWVHLVIWVPTDAIGHVLGDVASLRGRVDGLDTGDTHAEITAWCPERDLPALTVRVEAFAQGDARFEARGRRYEPMPASLRDEVLRARARQRRAD